MNSIQSATAQSARSVAMARVSTSRDQTQNVRTTSETRQEPNERVDITTKETTSILKEVTEKRLELAQSSSQASTPSPRQQQTSSNNETSSSPQSDSASSSEGITLGVAQNYLEAQNTANSSSASSGNLLNRVV